MGFLYKVNFKKVNFKNQSRIQPLLGFGLLTLIFSSCATLVDQAGLVNQTVGPTLAGAPNAADGLSANSAVNTALPRTNQPLFVHINAKGKYKGEEIQLQNSSFDLPVEVNPSVQKWINYFTGKGRAVFERYLERSEYFIPYLKPILRSAKAPEDLVYLAMIESGFNNNAKSHARAVGAWQFIAPTGRRYGLGINWWIDERKDVQKSTVAAIGYLKELNSMFSNWHLATAAYNAGEFKIIRAIKKYKTKDFWELCQKGRYLKPETKNYVPKLFAAAIISKNRKQFGFEESYTKSKSTNALSVAARSDEALEKLPDQLDSDRTVNSVTEGADATEPTVEITKDSPVDPDEESMLAEDSVEAMLKKMSGNVRTPHVNRQGEVNGDVLVEVEVPSPADLFKVSSAAGLSYAEFKSMNPELLRWVTPPSEKSYKIRLPLSHRDDFMKKYFDESFQRDVTFLEYKARKGDTPKKVAKRFGISPDPLAQMNDIHPNSSIMPGEIIELPIPSDFVRSLASLKSLDLIDPAYPKRQRRRVRIRRMKKQASHSYMHHSDEKTSF